jgi:hypothetical protein
MAEKKAFALEAGGEEGGRGFEKGSRTTLEPG